MKKALLPALILVILTACSGPAPSTDQEQGPGADRTQADGESEQGLMQQGPAPALPAERFPVKVRPGFEQARDVALFAQRAPVKVDPAPGLDKPETGTGEYANTGWKLPSSAGEPAPSEMRPQESVVDDVAPRLRSDEKIIPHERMVEDIIPGRMVEDIPPAPGM